MVIAIGAIRSPVECAQFSIREDFMTSSITKSEEQTAIRSVPQAQDVGPRSPACPVCGGPLVEIKQKLQCSQCRTICETCCEGSRG